MELEQSATEIITAPPITEQVVKLLRESILKGEYGPGGRINEVEVAGRMGVSRSPIREALQRLSKEGIISLVPRKGAFANVPNIKDIKDLFEVRETLEVFAVGLAAKRATDNMIDQLTEFLRKTEIAIEKNAYEQYPWNFDFHKQIAKTSENYVLKDQISEINGRLLLVRYFSGSETGRAIKALEEHREIVEAIKNQNISKAKKIMKIHIEVSKINVLSFIKNSG